jgi:hypothetical protein
MPMPISIDLSQLDASELDELMAKAAERRALLEPAHAFQAPAEAEAIIDPAWYTGLIEPGTLFQVRHPGYGWLSFVIPPNERAQLLCAFLNQALFASQTSVAAAPAPVAGGSTVH